MSSYSRVVNFTAKDALLTGNPSKLVVGADFDSEFNAAQTAINSKADTASPTFTGTVTAANLTISGTFTGTVDGGTY